MRLPWQDGKAKVDLMKRLIDSSWAQEDREVECNCKGELKRSGLKTNKPPDSKGFAGIVFSDTNFRSFDQNTYRK